MTYRIHDNFVPSDHEFLQKKIVAVVLDHQSSSSCWYQERWEEEG